MRHRRAEDKHMKDGLAGATKIAPARPLRQNRPGKARANLRQGRKRGREADGLLYYSHASIHSGMPSFISTWR